MHTEHENRTNGPRPGTTESSTTTVSHSSGLTTGGDMAVDLLKRIDTIINNTSYLNETANAIRQLAESGEIDDPAIANSYVEGLCHIVTQREQTNQKAIELIRDMYDGMKSTGKSVSGASIAENAVMLGLDIADLIKSMEPERALIFTREVLGMGN